MRGPGAIAGRERVAQAAVGAGEVADERDARLERRARVPGRLERPLRDRRRQDLRQVDGRERDVVVAVEDTRHQPEPGEVDRVGVGRAQVLADLRDAVVFDLTSSGPAKLAGRVEHVGLSQDIALGDGSWSHLRAVSSRSASRWSTSAAAHASGSCASSASTIALVLGRRPRRARGAAGSHRASRRARSRAAGRGNAWRIGKRAPSAIFRWNSLVELEELVVETRGGRAALLDDQQPQLVDLSELHDLARTPDRDAFERLPEQLHLLAMVGREPANDRLPSRPDLDQTFLQQSARAPGGPAFASLRAARRAPIRRGRFREAGRR